MDITMMHGQEPYTKEELKIVRQLYEAACEAERFFSLDELEEHSHLYRKILGIGD